jgi:broad specificity phosphatase PhoE
MKIIFVRNGESNLKTDKLTLRGHLQVRDTKNFLKDEDFDVIYSSPQIRALQTANILNKGRNKPFFILKGLDDRTPLPFEKQDEFGKDYKKYYFKYNYENENFQTCKDYLNQVFKAMEKITTENKKDATIVIVAHNSTLIAINAFFCGIPKSNTIAWTQTKGGTVIKFLI